MDRLHELAEIAKNNTEIALKYGSGRDHLSHAIQAETAVLVAIKTLVVTEVTVSVLKAQLKALTED